MLSDKTFEEFYRYFLVDSEKPNRPYSYILGNSKYRYLKDENHEWLVSMDIDYSIGITGSETSWILNHYVEIEDKDKVMLFKLTWVGK